MQEHRREDGQQGGDCGDLGRQHGALEQPRRDKAVSEDRLLHGRAQRPFPEEDHHADGDEQPGQQRGAACGIVVADRNHGPNA